MHDSLHPEGIDDEYTYARDSMGNLILQSNGQATALPSSFPNASANIMGPNMGNFLEPSQVLRDPSLKNSNVVIKHVP